MKNILIEYDKKIEDLISYINNVQEIKKILSTKRTEPLDIKLQKLYNQTSKRIYDYNLIIITIYGILEGFIEQIIKTYLTMMGESVKKYSELPEEIKKNHIQFSAELIKNCNKFSKYSLNSERCIVENLYNCINSKENFTLNVDAFTNHSSNFRKESIREIFKNVGIINITHDICQEEVMKQYFINYENIEEKDFESYSEDSYYLILDDIVERRNCIAHGSDVVEILSLDILKNKVVYIKALVESIYNICNKNLQIFRYNNNEKINLGKPITVYDNSIVCINSQNVLIKEGMMVYAINKDLTEIRYGRILSIQENGIDIKEINVDNNVAIGIKVDFYAKKDWKYLVLK